MNATNELLRAILKMDEEERLRQYARALDALSPSPDVADKTARLLAARLGI